MRRRHAPALSGVALAAAGLAAVSILIRVWVASSGYFSLDDYVFYTRSAALPLWSEELLLTPYNGHLMPGAMIWVWVSTQLAPLAFTPVFLTCIALQLVIDWLFYLVLRKLFGTRRGILVPFTVFLFTTLTLPALVWWAAALNQLPQQLAMLGALLVHLRFVETGRLRYALASTGCIAGGLAFSEKTALTIPLIFAITWLFLTPGSLLSSLRATIRTYWMAWVVYLAAGAAYTTYYLLNVESPLREGRTFSQAVEMLDMALRDTVVPGLVGGPWTWAPVGEVDSLADPHPVAQVIAMLVVGGAVVLSMRLHKGAGRAWAFAALALLVEVALIWATRAQLVGAAAVASEYRYFTDYATVAVLALAFAFLPVRTAAQVEGPPILSPRPGAPELSGEAIREHFPTALGFLCVALVVSSAISAATYRTRWSDNPGREYFANADHDLRAQKTPPVLYNGPVPTRVVWRLLWPATLPSRLLPPRGLEFTTLKRGEPTSRLMDLAADGHLRRSQVTGYPAEPGPDTGCGWRIEDETVEIPLESDAFYWDWIVALSYDAEEDVTLRLSAGRTSTRLRLAPGGHTVYVRIEGRVSSLRLATEGGSSSVCVEQATVGLPQPVEW
jgi:hypothetical protein